MSEEAVPADSYRVFEQLGCACLRRVSTRLITAHLTWIQAGKLGGAPCRGPAGRADWRAGRRVGGGGEWFERGIERRGWRARRA